MAKTSSAETESSSNLNDKGSSNSSPDKYRAYHWRWLLLLVLCILSVSNGMVSSINYCKVLCLYVSPQLWLTFSPIPNDCASFYRISMDNVDWFSNSYFTASLIMGFFSIWVLDTYQLRVAVSVVTLQLQCVCKIALLGLYLHHFLYHCTSSHCHFVTIQIFIGAVLNFAGAVIRYASTFPIIICSSQFPQAGFGIAMLGQVLTAFAQPFFLYAPTKLANTWFKPSERSICTGISTLGNKTTINSSLPLISVFYSLANTLGVAAVQVISPEVVKNSTDLPTLVGDSAMHHLNVQHTIIIQLWILIIPAGIGGLLSLTYIHSKPPIPPAPSGNVWQEPFFKGLKLVCSK